MVVGAALGKGLKSAASVSTPYGRTCSYSGGGITPTKISFQRDTTASFAAGEKAAEAFGVVNVHSLGKAAWAEKGGGLLAVFEGTSSFEILAPLTSLARLEALARKII